MFCSKCGSPNPDNAAFCSACGSPLSAPQPMPTQTAAPYAPAPDFNPSAYAPQPTPDPYAQPTANPYTQPDPYAQPNPYAQPAPYGYEQPAKKKKKLLPWLIVGGVAVVAIVVILIIVLGGGNGYSNPEDAALDFIKGVLSGDYDDVCDALYPDLADELDEDDFDELLSYLGDIEVSNYSVDDKERGDKSDRTYYEEFLEENDIDAEIDDLYYVKVSFDVDMYGYSNSASVKVIVAEIDGRWYVITSDFM